MADVGPEEVVEELPEEQEAEQAPEGGEPADVGDVSEDQVWEAVHGEQVEVPDDEAADDESTKEA